MEDQPIIYTTCPRCDYESYEHLRSYSHCLDCGFNTVENAKSHYAIPADALAFLECSQPHKPKTQLNAPALMAVS
jgi:hypothetical protein